jgi:ABC-type multidrug transport system ATPase subunit
MKQKLALCCALIHYPTVLFLDEPTTGVDPVSRKEFWEMLKRLQKKGITILVSTPYMDEAALCDRIALIQDGEILEIDTPEAIVHKFPKTLYNVGADNMYQLIQSLTNYEHLYSVYPFGEFVHYTDKRSLFEISDLLLYLKGQGLKNITIQLTQPTIEDTFMELAKK